MWFNMFDLAHAYAQGEGMKHYVEKVQQPEFAAGKDGYTFVSHQQEVGTGYFDNVTTIIQGGTSSVTALTGSTEEAQFYLFPLGERVGGEGEYMSRGLELLIAQTILQGFDAQYGRFLEVTSGAQQRFEHADWHAVQQAMKQRIHLYDHHVGLVVEQLRCITDGKSPDADFYCA